MRTALLTTALIMATTMAWGDEPSAPPTKPAEQATTATETATSDSAAAAQTAAAVEQKTIPLKPPAGYRPKRVNGEQVWCAKQVVLGSRFPKEDCRNEAELRELIRIRESMRNDMDQRLRTCTSSNGACGLN